MENSELEEARRSVCERSPVMPRPAVCWCRTCRRKLEHGRFLRLHDGSGRAQAEPWVRTCCQDMWLGLGWFCHWCGRSQDWGTETTAQGIYGGRDNDIMESPLQCECGCRLAQQFNYTSCRGCYWVITRHLVRRFLAVLGPWSHLHEHIFSYLIEPRLRRAPSRGSVGSRAGDLVDVRQCGLLEGGALRYPGTTAVGWIGQQDFARRYRMGDVDWIPQSEAPGPHSCHGHVLVWCPPMVPPPRQALERLAQELANTARHPLAPFISDREARGFFVVEQQYTSGMLRHDPRMAPCVWCGHFVSSCCDGVPPSSASRGWSCQLRVCSLCQSLYARCRFCCLWTGLPVRAAQAAIDRCQRSRVDFGPIARACLTGKLPWELLPWPLLLDFGRFCAGETDEDEMPPAWAESIVRRALHEDV